MTNGIALQRQVYILGEGDEEDFLEGSEPVHAKTKKFYPAKSYPARGTEVRYRRFFQTTEEAIAAGFVPSKLVK